MYKVLKMCHFHLADDFLFFDPQISTVQLELKRVNEEVTIFSMSFPPRIIITTQIGILFVKAHNLNKNRREVV